MNRMPRRHHPRDELAEILLGIVVTAFGVTVLLLLGLLS